MRKQTIGICLFLALLLGAGCSFGKGGSTNGSNKNTPAKPAGPFVSIQTKQGPVLDGEIIVYMASTICHTGPCVDKLVPRRYITNDQGKIQLPDTNKLDKVELQATGYKRVHLTTDGVKQSNGDWVLTLVTQ